MGLRSIVLIILFSFHAELFASHADTDTDPKEQVTLIGTYLNEDYIVVLHPVWEDIQGSWGQLQYDIRWDSDFKTLEGRAAHDDVFVEFSSSLKQIFGETSTCGWIDLFYTSSAPWTLRGRLCEEELDKSFETEASMQRWIEGRVSSIVSEQFPKPTQEPVREFLDELMDFHIVEDSE